MENGLFGAL